MHPLVDTMLEAAQQAGHEHNPDFNGARQEGVGRFQLTQRDGLRVQHRRRVPAPGPAAPEPDGDDRTRYALRILFEGDRAVGVEVARDGRGRADPRRARGHPVGRRLPIAGLLMLSGIGPEDQLAPMGIEIREALPVGHEPAGPLHGAAQLPDRRAVAVHGGVTPENFALLRVGGPRAADLQHPGGGRLLPRPRRASTRRTSSSTSPRRCSSTRG